MWGAFCPDHHPIIVPMNFIYVGQDFFILFWCNIGHLFSPACAHKEKKIKSGCAQFMRKIYHLWYFIIIIFSNCGLNLIVKVIFLSGFNSFYCFFPGTRKAAKTIMCFGMNRIQTDSNSFYSGIEHFRDSSIIEQKAIRSHNYHKPFVIGIRGNFIDIFPEKRFSASQDEAGMRVDFRHLVN